MVTENTIHLGFRDRPGKSDQKETLYERGGNLVVPAFSVEQNTGTLFYPQDQSEHLFAGTILRGIHRQSVSG